MAGPLLLPNGYFAQGFGPPCTDMLTICDRSFENSTSIILDFGTAKTPFNIPAVESGDCPFGRKRILTFLAIPPMDSRNFSPALKSRGLSRTSQPEAHLEETLFLPDSNLAAIGLWQHLPVTVVFLQYYL